MKLMKLSDFRAEFFIAGSAPDVKTLKSDIDSGDLAGVVIGARYYVNVDALTGPLASLVEKVLSNGQKNPSGKSLHH